MEWRDRAVQDVEDSVEVLGLFYGGDVGRLFDYADQALVAGGAGAVDAGVDLGNVVADRAETKIGLHIANSGGQRIGVFVAGAENVERKTLRAFGADAGELFQLIDQARHGFSESGHGLPGCHSERSEERVQLGGDEQDAGILRFAQDDIWLK